MVIIQTVFTNYYFLQAILQVFAKYKSLIFLEIRTNSVNRALPLSYMMLSHGQTYFKKSCGVNTARFLKYLWPFSNTMHEGVKAFSEIPMQKGTQLSGQRLALRNQRFPVQVRLLAMCTGELSAVIAQLTSLLYCEL